MRVKREKTAVGLLLSRQQETAISKFHENNPEPSGDDGVICARAPTALQTLPKSRLFPNPLIPLTTLPPSDSYFDATDTTIILKVRAYLVRFKTFEVYTFIASTRRTQIQALLALLHVVGGSYTPLFGLTFRQSSSPVQGRVPTIPGSVSSALLENDWRKPQKYQHGQEHIAEENLAATQAGEMSSHEMIKDLNPGQRNAEAADKKTGVPSSGEAFRSSSGKRYYTPPEQPIIKDHNSTPTWL
ncbi:hypothetical protein F5Y06DRAFT_301170 [Hypoxylon sp. FL0890]|nr:hypothetical protein F5Y06DRAFT_301170 [Hypoxylon sp. FL0890]